LSTLTVHHRGCDLAGDIRGDGPPVVLIQGVGVHGAGWTPQVDVLSKHFRCLTFDNRGIARSQPQGDDPLSVELMVEDTARLMDSAGFDRAHIVGHSLGGLIALALALDHPSRVKSLSLLCTFADGRIPNRLTPWMIWTGLRTRIGPRRWRRRAFLRFVMPPEALRETENPDAVAERLAPLFGHDLADQPPVTMKQLAAMKHYDATPRLNEIRVSTLVLSAAHDPIAPPFAGHAIATGITQARYIEVPNASHGVPIQDADRVNQLLFDHLQQAQ
jgi:pimeloyl-ACP methyl ester carboxylesterase